MITQRPHLCTAFLVNHSANGLIGFDDFLDLIGRDGRLQGFDRQITLARVEQRQEAIVTGHGPIQMAGLKRITATTETVDDQGQGDLIEPWVQLLADKLLRPIVADG